MGVLGHHFIYGRVYEPYSLWHLFNDLDSCSGEAGYLS